MRRTPMPRAKKPIRRRNEKRRPAAAGTAQRLTVMERARDPEYDAARCEFERACAVLPGQGGICWHRCRVVGEQNLKTCHVRRRWACGDAALDPDVTIAGCKPCHDAADHRSPPSTWDRVRFPEYAVTRAVACIQRYEAEREAAGKAVVHLPETSTP